MKRRISLSTIVPALCTVVCLVFIVYFARIKLLIGLTRYFDPDEFAYLWWAHHLHLGFMPYRDFFFYSTPGFLWFLSPVFSFFSGVTAFVAARGLMTVVYLCFCLVGGWIYWEFRRHWTAVFVPLCMLFLPLPFDKALEIRPDTLALVFFSIGLALQVRHMREGGMTHRFRLATIGFLYAASLVVSQKMLLLVGVVGLSYIGWILMHDKKHAVHDVTFLMIGAGIVSLSTIIWLTAIGNWPMVWYSLTKLPFEITPLGNIKPNVLSASFFFYPSTDTVFGTGGVHLGYHLTILFWSVGIVMCAIRLWSPFAKSGKAGFWQELMLSACLAVSLIFFIWFSPYKHLQYLLPSGLFICLFVADAIGELWDHMARTAIGTTSFIVGFVVVCAGVYSGFWLINYPKLYWDNAATLHRLDTLYRVVPMDAPVLDLEGATVYYPAPYYVMGLPIGQIASVMSYQPPPLSERLIITDTKFIYQGDTKRLTTLSAEDQAFINERYIPIGDQTILVRRDAYGLYGVRLSQ